MSLYIAWFITAILSSTVHRIAGFGFGIITLAIMQYFSTNLPKTAALVSIIALMVPLSTLFSVGIRKVNWRTLLPLMIGYMIIQPMANKLIISMDLRTIRGVLGAFFLFISALSFIPNEKKQFHPTWYLGLLIGGFSGFLGGLFSISGPPAALFFIASCKDQDEYMATISAFFSITAIYSTVVRILYGIVTVEALPSIGAGLLGMVIGVLLGTKLIRCIKGDTFKKVVYFFIGLTGLWYVIAALFNL